MLAYSLRTDKLICTKIDALIPRGQKVISERLKVRKIILRLSPGERGSCSSEHKRKHWDQTCLEEKITGAKATIQKKKVHCSRSDKTKHDRRTVPRTKLFVSTRGLQKQRPQSQKTVRNSSPYQDALCISNYLYNNVTYSVAPEPKVPSPHSQQSETGSYPESTESTLHFQPFSKSSILIHLPSTPRSSEWSVSFGLSHQIVHLSLLSHVRYTGPPHSSWLDQPNDIWGWVQITKLLIVQLTSSFLGPNILLRCSFSNTLSLWYFLVWRVDNTVTTIILHYRDYILL
jgi:hypothetical protein